MKEMGQAPRDQPSSSSLRGVGSEPVPFFHRPTARRAASLALPDDAGSFTTNHPAYWHIGSCVTGAGFQLMKSFAGQIDDVRIYSKALDDDEVARLAGMGSDTTASR